MSDYEGRIRETAAAARREREAFDPPADPPAPDRAMHYCREGVGEVVAVYVEARTADWPVRFTPEEHRLLERALNDWLDLYARCYGVETDSSFAVREAAELLVDTHNVRDVAQMLTCVPDR
jgi:hypothetical protein